VPALIVTEVALVWLLLRHARSGGLVLPDLQTG
jgi:hypothetical protein